METVFRLKVSEFNESFIETIKTLFKNDKEFIAELVKQTFKLNISNNKINNIRSFKKILFHNIIDNVNDKGQVIIKKVRRK